MQSRNRDLRLSLPAEHWPCPLAKLLFKLPCTATYLLQCSRIVIPSFRLRLAPLRAPKASPADRHAAPLPDTNCGNHTSGNAVPAWDQIPRAQYLPPLVQSPVALFPV